MHAAGADQYTFHVEATDNPAECVRKIKETGMKVNHLSYDLRKPVLDKVQHKLTGYKLRMLDLC